MTAQEIAEPGYREVKSRRIKFAFGDETTKARYFVDGDVAMSHLVAMLSASFPPGEEAFIRSVHHYQPELTDPILIEQVKGFIGQEMTHGREHRNLNETLQEMGYPTKFLDDLAPALQALEKVVPAVLPLALTAAAEHFTATLAERVLGNKEYIDHVAYDDEMKGMLNWHAFEELEHKAVAFDVFRAVGGSEALRIGSMAVMIPGGVLASLLGMGLSMALDPNAVRRPLKTLRSIAALPRNPIFNNLLSDLLVYLKPGFHPDDVQTDDLLEECRERFFGKDGELVHNLK